MLFKIIPEPVPMCLPLGNCQHIAEDMNEDTISVLVRLITEKKGMCSAKSQRHHKSPEMSPLKNEFWILSENAAALEELLMEYESRQMGTNKGSSFKYVAHTSPQIIIIIIIIIIFSMFYCFQLQRATHDPLVANCNEIIFWKFVEVQIILPVCSSDRLLKRDLQISFSLIFIAESKCW